MPRVNNGTSMKSQRPSRTTNGDLIHSISKATEDLPMSGALLPIQDGGRYSDMRAKCLKMKMPRRL
jgi:hypothetical protein